MKALAIFLIALPLLGQQELVENGDFKKGMTKWYFGAFQDFKGKVFPKIKRVDGDPALVVEIPAAEKGWVYVNQLVDLQADKTYRVSMECRAEGTGKLALKVTQYTKPFQPCGASREFEPSKEWRRYEIIFNARNLENNKPGVRVVLGNYRGAVSVRNLSLLEMPARKIEDKNGKFQIFTVTGEPVPWGTTKQAKPQLPPQQESGDKVSKARELAAAFGRDLAGAKATYQGTAIRVRGRVTNIEPALAGDTLVELDGGSVSILVSEGEISSGQDRFVKGELSIAKQQGRNEAYPRAELTGAVVGYRRGSVKMRNGKNVTFEKGD